MTKPTTLPRIFSVTACLALSVLLACSSAMSRNAEPVTWYAGFTLPELLAEPHPARTKEDIRTMLSQPWYAEIIVAPVSKPDENIALSSCAQYLAQPAGRLESVRERDGAPFMELAMRCQAAQAILAAQPARQSNIPSQFIDKDLPRLLPPEVAMVVSVQESKRLLANKNNRSWGDISRIKKGAILAPNRASFSSDEGSQLIELVARGDFNGDGLEDVMFTSRDSVEGGTYSALRLFQITRRTQDGKYELLRQYHQ